MGFFNKSEQQQQQFENIEQSNVQGQGSPYYQPMIMASEKADLYDKIRPEDVVETIRYLFMGYEWDNRLQEWKFNPLYKNVALSKLGAVLIY